MVFMGSDPDPDRWSSDRRDTAIRVPWQDGNQKTIIGGDRSLRDFRNLLYDN